MSQRLEQHHKLPAIWLPFLSWRASPASLGLFALMLAFVLRTWERRSAFWSACSCAGRGLPT